MKRKFEKFQPVVLERDLVKSFEVGLIEGTELAKGAQGVVVDYLIRDGIAVEFFNENGQTIEVASIPESYVRAATEAEIDESRRSRHHLKSAR